MIAKAVKTWEMNHDCDCRVKLKNYILQVSQMKNASWEWKYGLP